MSKEMPSIIERKFMLKERDRLARFQHQHRGLNFLKVWLPPTTDRNVNIIGVNKHVFKGQIPSVPIDELPPDVDPKSIDEEELYEEIKNMNFSEVPPQDDLGPSRRIGGEYTNAKQLFFAPVSVRNQSENKVEAPVLGADGHVYRGTVKPAVVTELNRKLRGTKRIVRSRAAKSSTREIIEPSVVSLHVDGRTLAENGQPPVPLIQMPLSQLNRMLEVVKRQEIRTRKKSSQISKSKNSGLDLSSSVVNINSGSNHSEKFTGSNAAEEETVTKNSARDEESGFEPELVINSGSKDSEKFTASNGTEEKSGKKNSAFEEDSYSKGGSVMKDSEKSSDSANSVFEDSKDGSNSDSEESFDVKDTEESFDVKDTEEGFEEAFGSTDSQPTAKMTEHDEVDVSYNEPTLTYIDENNNTQLGENTLRSTPDEDSQRENRESPEIEEENSSD